MATSAAFIHVVLVCCLCSPSWLCSATLGCALPLGCEPIVGIIRCGTKYVKDESRWHQARTAHGMTTTPGKAREESYRGVLRRNDCHN